MASKGNSSKGTMPRFIKVLLAVVLVATSVPALAFAGDEENLSIQATEQGSEGAASEEGAETDFAEEGEVSDAEGSLDQSPITDKILSSSDEPATATEAPQTQEGEISPLAGAPGTIAASITADNGTIDLSGTSDVAVMSYQQRANHVPYLYDLTIMLTDLSPSATNTLTITLPRGMKFQYTNISTFLAQAGQFALDVDSSSYTNGGTFGGATLPNGTYTFTLKQGVQATTLVVPISFTPIVQTDTITNAARVTLSDGSLSVSETLETVTHTIDGKVMHRSHSHASPYEVFTSGDMLTLPEACRGIDTRGTGNPVKQLISGGVFQIKITDAAAAGAGEDVRVKLINTDTTGQWVITSSNEATGDYTFTYTPPNGGVYNSTCIIPFDVEFASSASLAWAQDDEIEITHVSSGTYLTFVQFDEGDPAGNIGSSVSATASPQYLNLDSGHTFRYQEPGEKVWVNYSSNADYLNNITSGSAANNTVEADIDRADSNPSLNDEVGYLGHFFMGNAGSTKSTNKTVEIHFDATNYGVMALNIPYQAGETLAQVEYTTNLNSSWTTTTVNTRADATSGLAYLSYVSLGISDRTEFITGIRYEFGEIPAGSFYASQVVGGMAYFGKWLAANDNSTATATIEVFDTDSSSSVTTGLGSVTTARIDAHMVGFPSVPAATVNAGQVMNFTVPILTGSNMPYGNATTEHPIFYIRSEVKDENNNPLPVTNISLVNDREALVGQIDQSKLIITDWKVDEDGDGQDDVWVYKIDTSALPSSQVALMQKYVQSSNGALVNSGLTLSYQVATTPLSPSQTYDSRHMVYVLDKDATSTWLGSSSRQVTAASDPIIYGSIRHGEDWTKGVVLANSTLNTNTYKVNGVQSILVTSQIKHLTGSSWANYIGDAIPVGISAGSGFQLKTNIINNAGTPVTGTEVYIPIPKAGENWGSLKTGDIELSLMLKNGATVSSVGTGAIGSYTVKYGLNVSPTDSGSVLQGYTWVDASSVSDWGQVNCVQIIANSIADAANLEVILDAKADENQTTPTLIEGLTDVWHPTYYQDLSSPTGVYQGWYPGGDFGVQSALSALKGRLFNDANKDGIYDGSSENLAGTGWKIRIYPASDPSNALQEISLNADGTYAFYDLVSASNEAYTLEVVNPYNDDTSSPYYMFTCTATRQNDSSTDPYVAWGANTFVTGNEDDTATASASAKPTQAGTSSYAPTDISNEVVYNIGVTAKTATTHTWKSADTTKGTVAGDSGTGTKTLSGYPSTALDAAAAPAVTAATGYTFTGWARVAAGDSAPAWDAAPWKTASAVLNSDFGAGNGKYGFDGYDYYAVFSVNTNSISYEYTGTVPAGANAFLPSVETGVAFGTSKTVSSTPAAGALPGYTFSGWTATTASNVAPDGNGDYTMPDNAVVFEGSWTMNTHSITYEYTGTAPAGAAAFLPSAETGVAYGVAKTVSTTPSSASSAAVPGYTFSGWTATAASNLTVTGGAYSMPDNAVVFQGSWSANTDTVYKVHHYKVDSSGNAVCETTETKTGTTDTSVTAAPLSTAAFTGYTYTAGYANGSDQELKTGIIDGAGTLELNLYYVVNSYTVSYNANSGSGVAPANQSVYYGEGFTTASNAFAKLGYNFAGWNTRADGQGVNYAANESATYRTLGNTTLFAQWDPASGIAYRVEHYTVDAGGSPVLAATDQRTGTTGATVYAAQRSFTGYSYNASFLGALSSGAVAADGSLVLRMYYSIDYFTVTFVDWDGSVLATRSVPYGANATAPASPSRVGYTFTGWNRSFNNITSSLTVTAQYAPLTYTVTFVSHDGTVLQTSTVNHGGSVTPPANPTRDGFRFTGWDKDDSAWTNVTADATIRALFDDETTERPVTSVTRPSTSTTTPTTPDEEPLTSETPAEKLARAAAEQDIPSIGVPLAAPSGHSAWALANLVLAVLGILMALVFGVVRSSRKTEDAEGNPRSIGWLIAAGVIAVAGALLFVLTQDISLPMVWVDFWTIAQAIALVALLICGNVAIRYKKDDSGNKKERVAPATA